MQKCAIGQRWISEMEPELGLGIITEVSSRQVRLSFPAAETTRQYAIASAPIKRLVFTVGDTIKTRSGEKYTITEIENRDEVLIYICENRRISEAELHSVFSHASPLHRLKSGFFDLNSDFILRIQALEWRAKHAQSPAFGFIGARIDLIPHQLYVVWNVVSRQNPRVLLSDEVGLGKTIEACLILHQLLLSRRISRVLIIVPESLLHQWFVELLRRFNLVFRIVDADYVASLPEDTSDPFDEDQLALISLEFLKNGPKLTNHALNAEWDMLVVDEVHHILEESPEYHMMQQLADNSKGLLLLTATPEQLGHRSHFARLKLLDPSRYHDFDQFEREENDYLKTAGLVNKLLEQKALEASDINLLHKVDPTLSPEKLRNETKRDLLIQQLIDRYGPGRVMYRNTRAAIPNFPRRRVHFYPHNATATALRTLEGEFAADCQNKSSLEYHYQQDARLLWCVDFLQRQKSKILLICHTQQKAVAVHTALARHINVKAALFHEQMTLLQRDRFAAWFAEQDGAQLLICSEIGSEGRNFQFAHHLILFDVPLDPELLEQRIGRLDRIGQRHTIHIHVPYVVGTPQEALIRWTHEGFNAFATNAAAAFLIYEKFGQAFQNSAMAQDKAVLEAILHATREYNTNMLQELKLGRNRLLELNSFNPAVAAHLKNEILSLEKESAFAYLMLRLFEHFGVTHDEISEQIHLIGMDHLTHPDFPFPPFRTEHVPVSFDRHTALSRQDVEFITPDHPMVMGVLDLYLGLEKGTVVCATWQSDSPALFLEAFYIIECLAPARLFIERFFPQTSIRVVVNHAGEDVTKAISFELLNKKTKATTSSHVENPVIMRDMLSPMVEKCQHIALGQAEKEKIKRLTQTKEIVRAEIERLEYLQQVNPNVSSKEIQALKEERDTILHSIQSARSRLDAVRFIIKGNF
ncbi:RNA polymerase-associated protein RapA [candidate division KSB1 bacterium]|nr:RNA polymerase-associated protein RapA [candidate division KSB1 bacterium]